MSGWSYYVIATTLGATLLGVLFASISVIDVCNNIRQFENEAHEKLNAFKVYFFIFSVSI